MPVEQVKEAIAAASARAAEKRRTEIALAVDSERAIAEKATRARAQALARLSIGPAIKVL